MPSEEAAGGCTGDMKTNDIIKKVATMRNLHIESRRKLKEIAKHQDAIRKLEIEIYDIEHDFTAFYNSICKDLRSEEND